VAKSNLKETALAERYAYRVPEAAKLLGLCPRTINDLIATGRLRSVKIGGSRRVTPEAIKQMLAEAEGA